MEVGLRPLVADDADWIAAACQDPDIQRWTTVPRPYTEQHATDFITSASKSSVDVWAITVDGAGVGMIAVHSVDATTGEATIGYWVAPTARSVGVARSALLQLARSVHARVEVSRLVAVIADSNKASQNAAQAAGFTALAGAAFASDGDDQRAPATRWSRDVS
jgi:RimJ/RimL family protein N-acetyltransferase